MSTVVLSADGVRVLRRVNEINTPFVLENPWFEAWPPEITANGVLVEAMIFNYVLLSEFWMLL